MPDIFDQIAPDQIASAPKGDIFDQIAPDPKPNALASARQTAAPDHSEVIRQQLVDAVNKQHANENRGAFENFSNAFAAHAIKPLGNLGSRLINTLTGNAMNPDSESGDAGDNPNKTFQDARAKTQQDIKEGENWSAQQFPTDETRTSGDIGAKLGGVAPVILSGAAAPAMMVATGAENRQEDIEHREANNQTITPGQKAAYLGGGALLDYGIGKLAPGGAASEAILGKVAPAVTNPLAAAALRMTTAAATGAPEMAAYNTASNLIGQKSGVTPEVGAFQGTGDALLQGGFLGAGGQAIHEAGSALTPKQRPASLEQPQQAPHADGGNNNVAEVTEAHVADNRQAEPTPEEHQQIADLQKRMADHGKIEDALKADAPKGDIFDQIAPDSHPEADNALANARFQTPKESGSISVEDHQRLADMAKRMSDVDLSDRRQTKTEVNPEDERRFDELTKNSTTQSPEEAGASPFFSKLRSTSEPQVSSDARVDAEQASDQKPVGNAEGNGGGQPDGGATNNPFREAAKKLLSDETGSHVGLNRFADSTVKPALRDAASGVHDVLKTIDHEFSLGGTSTKEGTDVGHGLRKTLGAAEAAGRTFEGAIKPGIEAIDKMPDAQKIATHELLESNDTHGANLPPEVKDAADALKARRDLLDERNRKLGRNNLDEEGEGASRIFDFPEGKGGGKGMSAAGKRDFLRKQSDLSYGEQLDAVRKMGGDQRYDNPLTTQAARIYEAEHNTAMHENIRQEELDGNIHWGDEPTDAHDTQLTDPQLGKETRKLAAPKWMVGKFANMENGFEANKFLDQNKDSMVPVRGGEQPPEGYAFTDRTQEGNFYGSQDVASKYNNLVPPAKGGKLAQYGQKAVAATIKARYALSGGHAMMATNVGFNQQIMNSLTRAKAGEWGPAAKSLNDAFFGVGGTIKGEGVRSNIREGKIGDVEQRVLNAGSALKIKGLTDKSWVDKSADAWENGDHYKAAFEGVKGVVSTIHDETFNRILPDVVAGHLASVAEDQINRGISSDEGHAQLVDEAKRISRQVGNHFTDPDYKNNAIRKIANILIPAYRFWEGNAINVGKAVLGDVPSMKASAAFFGTTAVTTAVFSTMLQATLTKINTGKAIMPNSLEDFLHPRNGKKDKNGNDARITYPNALTRVVDTISHPVKELKAILNPIFGGAYETATNKDWQGNQVRPTDGSTLGNTARGTYHTLKGALPMSNPYDPFAAPGSQQKGVLDTVGGALGIRVSHPVTSDAQNTAYDILQNKSGNSTGRTLADQNLHANEKRWVGMINDADPSQKQQAINEMLKDPDMTEERGVGLMRRADAQKRSPGLAGLVSDTQLDVHDLSKIWDRATPEEKTAMHDTLGSRIGRAEKARDLSRNDADAWKLLQKSWNESGK